MIKWRRCLKNDWSWKENFCMNLFSSFDDANTNANKNTNIGTTKTRFLKIRGELLYESRILLWWCKSLLSSHLCLSWKEIWQASEAIYRWLSGFRYLWSKRNISWFFGKPLKPFAVDDLDFVICIRNIPFKEIWQASEAIYRWWSGKRNISWFFGKPLQPFAVDDLDFLDSHSWLSFVQLDLQP